jgi:glycosyltransferase involved in cell wall biosynthesis
VRVIVVTSWFPTKRTPHFSPFVRDFVTRLFARRIKIWLFTPNQPILNEVLSGSEDITCVWGIIGPLIFMRTILSAEDFIVHVHSPNLYSTIYILIARLFKRSIIATIHRAEVAQEIPWFLRLARRMVLGLLTSAVCVSSFTRLLAISAGCPPNRTVVIYNAVNEKIFRPMPQNIARLSLSLPLNGIVLLFVGNLVDSKGCEILLRAFAGLRDGASLFVIGDGPLKEDLNELGKHLGISQNVVFLGQVSPDMLALYYNAADVFVLPSFVEGNSVALLEAMASGIPAVVTRVGGNPESVIDGETGILVEAGGVKDLRLACENLIQSKELRERMGTSARSYYLRKFSEIEQLKQTLSLYHGILLSEKHIPLGSN